MSDMTDMTDTAAIPADVSAATSDLPPYIVLYDGVCGLCHRGVRALMDLDKDRELHFAPLQGDTAARLGIDWDPEALPIDATFVFVDNTGAAPVHHERMDGVVAELRAIGRMPALATVLRVTPKPIANGLYRVIAASRYRLFGRFDECKLPTRSQRERFLP